METKPAVIPQHTSHCPAISYAYPLGSGQACAVRVYEDRKEHTFSFKMLRKLQQRAFSTQCPPLADMDENYNNPHDKNVFVHKIGRFIKLSNGTRPEALKPRSNELVMES